MKNLNNNISLFCIFLVITFYSVSSGAENSAEMAIGSRSFAMGQSTTIKSSDLLNTFNFPASLSQLNTINSAIYYSSPFENTKNMRFGFSTPLKRYGTLSINYFRFEINNSDWRNPNGQIVDTFSYLQHEFVLSYGRKLSEILLFGMNAKLIVDGFTNVAQNEPNDKNIGIDFSMGYLPRFKQEWIKNLGIGFVFKNVVQANENYDHIPKEYRLIAENKYIKNKNSVHLAINYVWYENSINEFDTRFHVGFEYGYDFVFARIGHNDDRFTLGGGLRYRNFSFDYGYGSDYDYIYFFRDQHNFSLSAGF